jgi:type II secretory pathway component PulF
MVRHIEKAYFQMATLLDAGIPIMRSLQTVAAGQRQRLKKAFAFLEEQVSQGSQLNEAMAKKRRIFAPLDITMVAAAEQSGNLPATFKMLADWYEQQVRLRRKLIGGMAVPVVILHLAIFLAELTPMFLGHTTLSQYFQICFTKLAWIWGIFLAVYLLLKLIPKQGIIRLPFDSFVLIIPLLGKPLYHLALSRFCRSFFMLYSSGIPIISAAELATGLTGNASVSKMVAGAAKSARAGRPMYHGFSRQLLPVELYSLWETGEESGMLDNTTVHLAKMYEDLANHGFDVFIFWLPKIVYAVVMIYITILVLRNWAMVFGAAAGAL